MFNQIKKNLLAITTLAGTIIGVGIFSLPYITTKVGFGTMLGYLIFLTLVVLLIHLFFSEVALKTPDFLRLPGYAQIYLGKWGKRASLLVVIIGYLGTLLAYIVIGGEFLANLLMPFFDGKIPLYVVVYFIIGAFLIFVDIKAISKVEFLGMILFFLSLIIVFYKGLPFFKIGNLSWGSNINNFFLPYGPILFALWGATMIPEIEEMLSKDKKSIKKVVSIATIIPAVCYLFFIILIVLISGSSTSREAIFGLKNILGPGVTNIMFFAGILATFTSFITVGLTLKKVFWYDLKIPKNLSWLLAVFIPFLFYYLGFQDFIGIIGFVGGVMLAIEGILILLMYKKINPQKKVLVFPLILIFIAGIIYEIVYLVR